MSVAPSRTHYTVTSSGGRETEKGWSGARVSGLSIVDIAFDLARRADRGSRIEMREPSRPGFDRVWRFLVVSTAWPCVQQTDATWTPLKETARRGRPYKSSDNWGR